MIDAIIAPGKCFLLPIPNQEHQHLFVIITEINPTTGDMIIVSISTVDSDRFDRTTIIHAGDHPFIKHDSYVRYQDARFYSSTQLMELYRLKKAVMLDDMPAPIMEKIISGVTRSNRTKFEISDYFLGKLLGE